MNDCRLIFGLLSTSELAMLFDVTPELIRRWKRRAAIPSKHRALAHRAARHMIAAGDVPRWAVRRVNGQVVIARIRAKNLDGALKAGERCLHPSRRGVELDAQPEM